MKINIQFCVSFHDFSALVNALNLSDDHLANLFKISRNFYLLQIKVVLFRRAATMVMAASTLRELALNHRLFIEINLLVAMRRF